MIPIRPIPAVVEDTMKALRIHAFGSPDSPALEEIPLPEPGPGEVLVRVKAASVNPLDLKILAGQKQAAFPIAFPYTLGTDVAGVVAAVGEDVTDLRHGDRVVGRLDPKAGGAFAQFARVSASTLQLVPESLDLSRAAALPTAAGTAFQALIRAGQLTHGQRVLIHAGAGGVGSFAVQFAKQAGAFVIATASTHNLALVRKLGADRVIDRSYEDFTQCVSEVDLVLDTRGAETLERSWSVVKPGGRVVSIVDPQIRPRDGVHAQFATIQHDPVTLLALLQRVANGGLEVLIDSSFTLDDAPGALARVALGHAVGKVLIRMPE